MKMGIDIKQVNFKENACVVSQDQDNIILYICCGSKKLITFGSFFFKPVYIF